MVMHWSGARAVVKRPKSLRARLVALAAVPLIPAVVLVLLLIVMQSLQKQEQVQESALRVMRALSEAVASQLRQTEASLTALGASLALQEGDLAAFHKQAMSFQAATGLGTVVLLDRGGRQVVNTSRPFGAPLPSFGAAAPAMPVIVEGKPMAKVIKAGFTGQPVAVVSVPVRVAGEVRYALTTSVGFRRFDDLLRQQRLPPSWIGVLLDSQGIVVARTHESQRFVGQPAAKGLRDAVARSTEGAIDTVSLEGSEVRMLHASAGPGAWSIAVGVPKAELARELHMSLAWLLLATTGALVLAAALAWWYAARIGRAVVDLSNAAEAVGRGEVVVPQSSGILEADRLSTSLADASSQLRSAGAVLARNEARWSAVLESAMDGIIAVDASQRIVIYNPAAERMFGWTALEIMGQPLGKLIPMPHRMPHEALVRQFGQSGKSSRRMGEGRIVSALRKDGHEFPIEASISQVDTGGGKLYTVIVRDVTERVQAREELAQMAAEASMVREQEQARIARELHDDLAQSLAALKIDLKLFARQIESLPDDMRGQVDRMVDMVDASVSATRRIAADLRPRVLDDLGLTSAIEWLADEFTKRTGVPCTLNLEGELDLPEPYATGSFRILQESLTNAAKHARAHQVAVSAVLSASELVLQVVDDGVGFDTSQPRKQMSLGLAGLRERAHLLKGEVQVTSRPGQGTRVEVRIPYPPQ